MSIVDPNGNSLSTLDAQTEYFLGKQKEITELYNKVEPEKQRLIEEFNKKQEALKAEYTAKIQEVERPLVNLGEKYKGELKAWCGMTDGERVDVLTTVLAIKKALRL